MELSLNTYSECVESFRAADQLMGSAFRQKLTAYQRALELAGPEPERGFKSKFARETGVSRQYIDRIHRVTTDPDLSIAIDNFSSVGLNTLVALTKSDTETKTAALEQLERDGELTVRDIETVEAELAALLEQNPNIVDGDFETLDTPAPQPDIDLALITPSDRDIDQIVSSAHSAGQQLRVYLQKTRAPLETEKLATFIEIFATDLASSFGDDPEVYSGVISEIRLLSENLVTALDQVSDLPRPKLKIVK